MLIVWTKISMCQCSSEYYLPTSLIPLSGVLMRCMVMLKLPFWWHQHDVHSAHHLHFTVSKLSTRRLSQVIVWQTYRVYRHTGRQTDGCPQKYLPRRFASELSVINKSSTDCSISVKFCAVSIIHLCGRLYCCGRAVGINYAPAMHCRRTAPSAWRTKGFISHYIREPISTGFIGAYQVFFW